MTIAAPQPQQPHAKRWTKEEYNRLVDRGVFHEDSRFYLFRGELIQMPPMLHPHAMSVMQGTKLVFDIFDRNQFDIRCQLPFDVPGESMPEPDLLVCTTAAGRRVPHPSEAVLVIEVTQSSLAHDREKAFEYAAASVPEYWIVHLEQKCLEVYRDPVTDPAAPPGMRYSRQTVLKADELISPLAAPGATVAVADLL
jgi:Uma2 family endonuclease